MKNKKRNCHVSHCTVPVIYTHRYYTCVGLDCSLEIRNLSISLIMITAYHSYHFIQRLK